MSKKFIKLNVNDNYLSLGNLFRVIKENSINSSSFLQSELFCQIFNTYDIADSTINNYLTGFRAINPVYKNYIRNLKNSFENDKSVFLSMFLKIFEIIEDKKFLNISIDEINSNLKLKNICTKLYFISKNDVDANINISRILYNYLENNNLYEFFIETLFYVVLDKKQPIYEISEISNIIEKTIYNTNISIDDVQEFLKIQLSSGIWSLRGFKNLAENKNPLACFEMGAMEYYGVFSNTRRFYEAYKYFKIAADYNHPVATWAIGYLYYEGKIGNKSKKDMFMAFKYFNKARKLNCASAFNSLGLIFLNGNIQHIKKNIEKAKTYFNKACELGNVYAYNNLGKLYENENNLKKAFDCYLFSANFKESYACNKIGEYYRKGILHNKDMKKAFEYYNLAIDNSVFMVNSWAKYNLAKYFYLNGCTEIGIEKDVSKACALLNEIADDIFEANIELIFIYYDLFLNSKKKNNEYYKKLMFYKEKCENSCFYSEAIKESIEKRLVEIKKNVDDIIIP